MSMVDTFKNRVRLTGGIRQAARGFLRTPQAPAETTVDERRLARIADHEEDKQILTEVEKYDSDMLSRVRAALYED